MSTTSTPPANIQGSWQVLRAELGGQPMPADAASHVELQFTEKEYRVSFGGEATDEGTFQISDSSPHSIIEMTGISGVNSGKTIPGIFQLAGNRLRICYALEGNNPPTEFAAPNGTLHYLATYSRKN